MGLSKPIIITSSAVDTSNLATKSDMDTLKNVVSKSGGFINWGKVTRKEITTATKNVISLSGRYRIYYISIYANEGASAVTLNIDGNSYTVDEAVTYQKTAMIIVNRSVEGGKFYGLPLSAQVVGETIATFECQSNFSITTNYKCTGAVFYESLD